MWQYAIFVCRRRDDRYRTEKSSNAAVPNLCTRITKWFARNPRSRLVHGPRTSGSNRGRRRNWLADPWRPRREPHATIRTRFMYKLKGKSETITDDTGASVFSFLLLLLLLFIIIIIIRLSLSPFSFYIHFIIFTSFFLSLSFPFTFSSCLFSFCFIPIVGSSPLRELKSVHAHARKYTPTLTHKHT